MKGKQILNIESSKTFLLAGNSTFTVVSKETNKRYTFKVKRLNKNDNSPFFVKYLNGSDNSSSYQFLGTIFNGREYKHSQKSRCNKDSQVNKTFQWIFDVISSGNVKKFDKIEFWHEGKCGKCGRKLTVPSSIETGMGPSCSKK